MLRVEPPEKLNKIKQIRIIKRAMYETHKPLQIALLMMEHEVMRALIHPLHEAVGIADDRHPLPPGQRRRKESGDLYILFFCEAMRDSDRIILYECRPVVLLVFLL